MLVLTRKVGEVLVLTTETGVKIRIVNLGTSRGEVRLGIEAPIDKIKIDREESRFTVENQDKHG